MAHLHFCALPRNFNFQSGFTTETETKVQNNATFWQFQEKAIFVPKSLWQNTTFSLRHFFLRNPLSSKNHLLCYYIKCWRQMYHLSIFLRKWLFSSSNSSFLCLMQLLRSKSLHLGNKIRHQDFSKFSLRQWHIQSLQLTLE